MAQIITLPDAGSRVPKRAPKGSTGAKVLFFTGVRYERLETPSERRKPNPKQIKNT
jgi:hypothetical protein